VGYEKVSEKLLIYWGTHRGCGLDVLLVSYLDFEMGEMNGESKMR